MLITTIQDLFVFTPRTLLVGPQSDFYSKVAVCNIRRFNSGFS